jgi:hypothetical protein
LYSSVHHVCNVFNLDLKKRTITPGTSLLGLVKPVAGVVLTLLIEGLVFFLFGYRKLASWLIFLFVNIFTQGFLNIWIIKINNPLNWGHFILIKNITGEFWVFVLELAIFLILVREHSRRRTALYVISANLLSLVAGALIFPIVLIHW